MKAIQHSFCDIKWIYLEWNYLRWVWSSDISLSIFSCIALLSASKSSLACLRAAASTLATWLSSSASIEARWAVWFSLSLRQFHQLDEFQTRSYLLNNSSILQCSFSMFLTSFNRELNHKRWLKCLYNFFLERTNYIRKLFPTFQQSNLSASSKPWNYFIAIRVGSDWSSPHWPPPGEPRHRCSWGPRRESASCPRWSRGISWSELLIIHSSIN